MRASTAICDSIALRTNRDERHAIELHFTWAGRPRWQLLRSVTAVRSLLSDLLGCNVTIVASGPGCFFAVYAVPLPPAKFEEMLDMGAREGLGELAQRFDVSGLKVRTTSRTFTIFF